MTGQESKIELFGNVAPEVLQVHPFCLTLLFMSSISNTHNYLNFMSRQPSCMREPTVLTPPPKEQNLHRRLQIGDIVGDEQTIVGYAVDRTSLTLHDIAG